MTRQAAATPPIQGYFRPQDISVYGFIRTIYLGLVHLRGWAVPDFTGFRYVYFLFHTYSVILNTYLRRRCWMSHVTENEKFLIFFTEAHYT